MLHTLGYFFVLSQKKVSLKKGFTDFLINLYNVMSRDIRSIMVQLLMASTLACQSPNKSILYTALYRTICLHVASY